MVSTRQTDRQTDRLTDRQTTCQKWVLCNQHASSRSGDRFFGPMQYFLYTPYSRESKNLFRKTAQYFLGTHYISEKALSLHNGARYWKMLCNIKVAYVDLYQLLSDKKKLCNAFLKALFTKKKQTVLSGQRPHPLGDQKRFCTKSCVLWFVTTFVSKKILYNAFLRHFSPKNRIVLSGLRPHQWADFAHMQYRLRFLSYKIAYQIWLS